MSFRTPVLALLLLPAIFLGACGVQQRTFDTPEAAVAALQTAVADDNRDELRSLFGSRSDELRSGDPEQDRTDFVAFSSKITERTVLQESADNQKILLVGEEGWPFPVPLVSRNNRWRFDTDTGIEVLTDRRIGENELATIDALRAFVIAEREYQAVPRYSDGIRTYTTRLMSTPGQRDGLFWETAENEDPSPIGPVMAMAVARTGGEGTPEPYYGYLYKALTRQGPAAPGGAMDYMENNLLTRGVAAVAFPSAWGRTGIMTFIVSVEGAIYQRDLGPDTSAIVAAMDTFNPDEGWTRVDTSNQ